MSIPKVAVLLSSYNGELYIEQQVESILAQSGVLVTLYIRDDGSSDSTVKIVSDLAVKYPGIFFFPEKNIGLIKSFFDLLSRVGERFDYYAFADQDDFWLPDKIIAGARSLASVNVAMPAMYCSRTEYVNAYLKHLSYSPLYNERKIGFGNALVQNIATGCTIVLNAEARRLVVKKLPEKCLVHDWWIYLVVSAFGSVIYDDVSHIKYRQHGGNVIGASSSIMKNAINRTRRFFISWKESRTSLQIAEFGRIYSSELTSDQVASVRLILSARQGIWSRILLAFENFYWRQSLVDNFLLRIVILTGRF